MNKINVAEFEEEIIFNELNFAVIEFEGKDGAINKKGEIIIPFEYSHLIDFDEQTELILACNSENFWGFINWKNETIIPFDYSYASIFSEDYNLSAVCKNGKYGCINRNNQEIIPIEYDSITSISFDKMGVCKNQKWGIINLQNQQIIDFKYDFAICVTKNIYYVGKQVDEKLEDYDLETDLLTFKDGKLIKFGLIDEKENLLMDYESYLTSDYFGNNKVLAFDFPKYDNYLFDIKSKEKIYAPIEMDEDEKIEYLKSLLKK